VWNMIPRPTYRKFQSHKVFFISLTLPYQTFFD
jgi:hypothetical protein